MSGLPQVYATDAELASTDAMRDSMKQPDSPYNYQQTQQPFGQQQQPTKQLYRTNNDFAPSGTFSSTGSGSFGVVSPSASLRAQRPQAGIPSVPKESQSSWQQIAAQGPFEYHGSTFASAMSGHLPTPLSSGHAEGPQHLVGHIRSLETTSTLPDADHRQAWATQPTFRWFKRSDYDGVKDRWSEKEGLKGRGDNTYRPLSVREQQQINERVERRKQVKGAPRTGEW